MKGSEHSSPGDAPSSGEASTSLTLLQKVQRRDPDGWRRLCAIYTPLVRWWCHCSAVSRQDVKDLVQDVLVTVLTKVEKFERGPQRGSFRSWLREITRYKVQEYFRRSQSQPAGAGGDDARERLAQVPDVPEDEGDETEQAILLQAALEETRGRVKPLTWEAATRVLINNESPAEVAAALGITVNAVYIAKLRVRKLLQEELVGLLD
jgi:RNA polymerase sigma-70 factor (ECF subfamily)